MTFTLGRVVRRGPNYRRSRTHEAIPEQPDVASALTLVQGQEEEGDSRVEEEVLETELLETEVLETEVLETEVRDDPKQVPEEGPSVQANITTISLTINNTALGLRYGLGKRRWSEIQLRSVSLPLSLSPTAAHALATRAPALTLPLLLLSTFVPAPSPLPPSLLLQRVPSSGGGAFASDTPALSPPADEPASPHKEHAPRPPAPAREPGPKPSRLAGLYLLLSFFPFSRLIPICLPPACRKMPG